MELAPVLWQPGWKGSFKRMDTCVCIVNPFSVDLKILQHSYLAIPKQIKCLNEKKKNHRLSESFKTLITAIIISQIIVQNLYFLHIINTMLNN